jgi:uncharacterized membrane protein YfcA
MPELAATTVLLLAASAFAAGAFGAVFGLGSGILLSFAVTAAFGVTAVVPVVTAAMILGNAGRIWVYRGEVKRGPLLLALLAGAPAAVLGAVVHARMQPAAVAAVIGFVLLACIPVGRFARARNVALGPWGLSAAAMALGFFGSLGIGAGILAVPVLLAAGLTGPALIATDAALAVGTSLVRVASFSWLGLLPPRLLAASLLVGLATIPGAWIGARLARRLGTKRQALAVEVFAGCTGLVFLWQAWHLA